MDKQCVWSCAIAPFEGEQPWPESRSIPTLGRGEAPDSWSICESQFLLPAPHASASCSWCICESTTSASGASLAGVPAATSTRVKDAASSTYTSSLNSPSHIFSDGRYAPRISLAHRVLVASFSIFPVCPEDARMFGKRYSRKRTRKVVNDSTHQGWEYLRHLRCSKGVGCGAEHGEIVSGKRRRVCEERGMRVCEHGVNVLPIDSQQNPTCSAPSRRPLGIVQLFRT